MVTVTFTLRFRLKVCGVNEGVLLSASSLRGAGLLVLTCGQTSLLSPIHLLFGFLNVALCTKSEMPHEKSIILFVQRHCRACCSVGLGLLDLWYEFDHSSKACSDDSPLLRTLNASIVLVQLSLHNVCFYMADFDVVNFGFRREHCRHGCVAGYSCLFLFCKIVVYFDFSLKC